MSTRQWYIRNGARDGELRDTLIAHGQELAWHPEFMRVRYENWVGGLTGDWLVSRQRFFGVPIPLWYALDENGERDYDRVLAPDAATLPIDPTTDVPAGYTEDQRGVAGGFDAEADILDTWATSSLTPQLAGGWQRATRNSGTSPRRSTCARRVRTSSARGCSRPCCAPLSRRPDPVA